MAFHIFVSATGYFGVDVFFVLSGMLITGILLGEHDGRGRVDLRRFYERRMLRLYPALIAMLVLTTPFAAHLSGDGTWSAWWESVAAAATYTANLAILADGTQFLGALGPVWSLAVEMQFYLLWPLVFVWLLRRSIDRRLLTAGVALVAAGCLSLFWVLDTHGPKALAVAPSYFRPDSRFGELLTGCALALALSMRTGPLSRRAHVALSALAAVGIGGLLLAVHVHHTAGMVVPLPIVAVSTALILARLVTSDRALLSRLLRVPPLPQIGRISYAMYLWQLPILTLVSWLQPSARVQDVVFWGGTIVMGALSTHFVERPFLRRKDRLRATRVEAGLGGPSAPAAAGQPAHDRGGPPAGEPQPERRPVAVTVALAEAHAHRPAPAPDRADAPSADLDGGAA
jgi:peptidoglycan/LPS O-acetylase OafA/YrhL